MLRAQAFESLFTLVPILLVAVISIVLRARASRRRKQREQAAEGESVRGPSAGSASAGARTVRSAKAARFPWQRETSGIYPKRPAQTPPASAPFAPEHPRRSPVTSREHYAYPLPLTPEQAGPEPVARAGPGIPAAPQQVVRPSVESRLAVDRTAPPGEAGTLPLRKRAPLESGRPSPRAAVRKGSSISARLERFPPLKRAVIWAEILGPPGGRQQ